jgi:capsular polysaccharide biosynthesis protein
MAEGTTDLRGGLAELRRRWYLLVTAAVLGLAAGVLYSTRVPAQLESKALVQLYGGSSSAGDGDAAILTQVQLVLSTPVLAKAGAAVAPRLSAAAVKERIQVDAATSQLIEIKAFSPRAREAQALAQAVAVAYRDMLQDRARSVSGAIIADLEARKDALVRQNNELQAQILAVDKRSADEPPNSTAGIKDAQVKAQLTAARTDLVLKLNDVKSELAASGAISGGSSLADIAQDADSATGPGSLPGLISWAAVGALLGAVAATALVAVRARRDPRLRARDDMADAVGSSVLADVRSRPQRSVAEWSALFETYTASPVDAWAFRQLLRALATAPNGNGGGRGARGPGRLEHPPSVTVVTLSGDRRGLALAPQLAAFAASLGLTTQFVVATGHDAAASLRAACSAERASELRPGLRLDARTESAGRAPFPEVPDGASFDDLLTPATKNGSQVDQEEGGPLRLAIPRHAAPDLTIVLAVMDTREPTLDAVQPTAVTVLAIAPGVGTREDLARLAVAIDDAGSRIDGIVVADPDPSDRTTGRRTLEERARQVPLPLRVTGVGQPVPPGETGTSR